MDESEMKRILREHIRSVNKSVTDALRTFGENLAKMAVETSAELSRDVDERLERSLHATEELIDLSLEQERERNAEWRRSVEARLEALETRR